MKQVRKRNGHLVDWNQERITSAIKKAFEAINEGNGKIVKKISNKVTKKLTTKYGKNGVPTVEEIQDIVESTIMESGYYEVAKAYILYRNQRKDVRRLSFILDSSDLVDTYIGQEDWMIRENANIDYSVQGLNLYLTSKVISSFWLTRGYPPEARKAHIGGDLHIHDLSVLGAYCVGWDLGEILLEGFPRGVPGKTTSKPPKHFRVALKQSMNQMFTMSLEAAGAQAISNVDTLLAPYIAKDKLDYDETKQAIQEYMFDMNVGTRSGGQTPFTNVTFDRTIPDFIYEEPIIIGGKIQKDKYGDFQDEVDMFNEAYVEVCLEGDANGRIFSFPIPTYSITDDFDWEFPKFWEMVAKYGIPYFSNFINSDMKPEDVRSMCCRLRIDNRELIKRGGGFFGANPKTGSIGVVTLNMSRLGFLSKDDGDYFDRLQKLMNIARTSLIIKRELIEKLMESGMYPYSKYWLRSIKEAFGGYWKNHFSTIGLVGMNESCLNLFGEGIESDQGLKFAEKTLLFMRDVISKFQEEDDTIYNLEATPAESTSYRLARIDKEKFSDDIIVANERHLSNGAKPFYTNSTHLPVDSNKGMGWCLKHQDVLQPLYNGGTVHHIFLGEANPSPDAIKKIVKRTAENTTMPYFTITPTFSICPTHGYIGGEHWKCPDCGKETEVYSRIVGYFRPVKQWNEGKQSEFAIRKPYDRRGNFN